MTTEEFIENLKAAKAGVDCLTDEDIEFAEVLIAKLDGLETAVELLQPDLYANLDKYYEGWLEAKEGNVG